MVFGYFIAPMWRRHSCLMPHSFSGVIFEWVGFLRLQDVSWIGGSLPAAVWQLGLLNTMHHLVKDLLGSLPMGSRREFGSEDFDDAAHLREAISARWNATLLGG